MKKLVNKNTTNIKVFGEIVPCNEYGCIAVKTDQGVTWYYRSLAELNEEWEDYEEPKDKGYWYIDDLCRMRYSSELLDEIDDRPNNWMIRKLCGNYFDTREEAEKAVRKLKAWKQLKDKGFRFLPDASFIQQKNEVGESIGSISFTMDNENDYIWGNNKDLEILFGGEE